ncbi:MAG: type II secretion system F family protein [Simkaniaceae bacterium]|nr:type II secretion system F family protein [Candidatus Sacchlamyda saccharinae]
MPIYRYRALTETGKKVTGVIDADSFDLAKEKLKREKVLVTKLTSAKQKKEVALGPQLLLAFTRELEQLLKAGLPLYESLLTVEEKYRKHRAHSLLLDLCDKLKGGALLSTALKDYPRSFDSIYISMVQAGEKTGSLAWAFQQLHELIGRRQKLKKQLLSAMAYPAFLGGFCTLVILGLLLFVVPSMQELFEGRALHPLTQTVLSASKFLKSSFLSILLLLIALVLAVSYFFQRAEGKLFMQKLLQRIPIVKTVLLEAALIRFCKSSSILLTGGVPLLTALTISRKSMRHVLLEKAVSNAEKHLVEGKTLSGQLKKSPYIPPLVTRMLSIAEETGKLPQMLESLSDIYDQELERSLSHVTTFLQPILLVTLGGVVGLVILAILLPLTDVSSLISN